MFAKCYGLEGVTAITIVSFLSHICSCSSYLPCLLRKRKEKEY